MSLATPLRKVASKLMAKFGGVVTIRTVTPGAYNTSITADKVLIATVVHQVISVETIEQDNTAITYELILRA